MLSRNKSFFLEKGANFLEYTEKQKRGPCLHSETACNGSIGEPGKKRFFSINNIYRHFAIALKRFFCHPWLHFFIASYIAPQVVDYAFFESFQGGVSCVNSVWKRARISSTASSRMIVVLLSRLTI